MYMHSRSVPWVFCTHTHTLRVYYTIKAWCISVCSIGKAFSYGLKFGTNGSKSTPLFLCQFNKGNKLSVIRLLGRY